MSKINKLTALKGKPYIVNEKITILQPSLDEIVEFGSTRYLSLISILTSTSYDCRFQLFDAGIDYEDVEDFTMFAMLFPTLPIEETRIVFGELDCTNFVIKPSEDNDSIILVDEKNSIIIDELVYQLIVTYLRESYGLKRNFVHFGNAMARKFYMEDERRALEKKKENGENESEWLEPLISAMVNHENFKYNYDTVWQLTFYQFMDAVRRVQKINESANVSMGIYTGNIDTSKIDKSKLNKQLNWLGEL